MIRILLACLAVVLTSATPPGQSAQDADLETLPFAPRRAIAYRAPARPAIDGRLDEPGWQRAAWSDLFVDIAGDRRPRPRFATRVKMLWDADRFYVAAEMEEPDLWATLTTRDAVIFHDNDFEIFIDPDADTHAYYELEVNVLRTAWDLLLVQPYRDGGPPIDGWDIAGLEVGVDARGTVNRPGDRDQGWTVEIAMPWRALQEAAPGRKPPAPGAQWRVNFSRVEWQVGVRDGRYVKRAEPATTKPLPEDNWVWSPQGVVDMHMPERWGYVQFSGIVAGAGAESFVEDPNEQVKWALRRLYYRQRRFRSASGRFASDLSALGGSAIRVDGLVFRPEIETTGSLYEIRAPGFGGATVHIRQDGRVWTSRRP